MDTKDVAVHLGTTPRVLRQFLRSGRSTFVAVGSGARYEFTEADIPTLIKRFSEWQTSGKPRPNRAPVDTVTRKPRTDKRRKQDEAEWAEEGPVAIPDIRDPRVRARVKRDAQAAENRLMVLLMAKGLHVTQRGNDYTEAKAS
jgi:hypothetical protein